MNTKIISFLMIIFTFCSLNAKEDREFTKFSVLGSMYGNFNLYNADFLNLPGYSSCCTEFRGGSGIAFSFGLGGEYLLNRDLLAGLSYRFTAGYSDFSGIISEEEIIGYDIEGANYSNIIVDFSYNNIIPVISTEHLLLLKIKESIPLSIIAGINIGIPLSGTTEYQEKLLQPSGRYFENGEQTRNKQAGDINDLSSLYFGISAGASYEVYNSGGFSINPELLYTYGLTDLVSSVDWSASQIRGGLTVKYNIPVAKPEPIKPQDPPKPILPEIPLPPEAPILASNITIFANGDIVENNSEISQSYILNSQVENKNVLGVIFYRENDADEDIESVIKSLKYNKINEIELKIYSAASESITKYFQDKIFNNNIKIKNIIRENINLEDTKYQELEGESDRLEIMANGKVYSDYYKDIVSTDTVFDKLIINLRNEIKANYDITNEDYKLTINNQPVPSFSKNTDTDVTKYLRHGNNSIEIQVNLASENIEKSDNFSFNVMNFPTKANIQSTTAYESDIQLLAYSNFDETDFYSVNQNLLQSAIKHLSESPDNKLAISASSDNLGEEDYNKSLKARRARNAVRLFPKELQSQIIISESPFQDFDNSLSSGRIKNRSIAIIFN